MEGEIIELFIRQLIKWQLKDLSRGLGFVNSVYDDDGLREAWTEAEGEQQSPHTSPDIHHVDIVRNLIVPLKMLYYLTAEAIIAEEPISAAKNQSALGAEIGQLIFSEVIHAQFGARGFVHPQPL